jgi:hypothetical protein
MYFIKIFTSIFSFCALVFATPGYTQAKEAVSGTTVAKPRVGQNSATADVLCKGIYDVKNHGDCLEWKASLEASILHRAEISCEGRPTEEFKSVAGLAACIAVEASKWRELETKNITECGGFDARTKDKEKFEICTKSKRPKWG